MDLDVFFRPLINHYIKLQPPRKIVFCQRNELKFCLPEYFPIYFTILVSKFEKKIFSEQSTLLLLLLLYILQNEVLMAMGTPFL